MREPSSSQRDDPGPLRPPRPVVTTALIGICCAWFAVLWFAGQLEADPANGGVSEFALRSLWAVPNDAELIQRYGGLELTRVWIDGEWWRVLTAVFVHGSWLHLGLNMSALWSIGEWVEALRGRAWTFVLFILSGIGGCLASLAWAEAAIVVGASGAIMGLAGALWFARRYGSHADQGILEAVSARRLGIMIVLVLALGAAVPIIAQAGHVGGLLVGLALGAIVTHSAGLLRPVLVGLASAASLAPLAHFGAEPAFRVNFHTFTGFRHLRAGDATRALPSLERALEMEPADPSLANAVAYELSLVGTQLGRAMQLVEFALEQEPDNADYLDTKGWILCRQGDAKEGAVWLDRAVEALEEPVEEISEHVETCAEAKVETEAKGGDGNGAADKPAGRST